MAKVVFSKLTLFYGAVQSILRYFEPYG